MYVTAQQFSKILNLLDVEKNPRENVEGYFDVRFCRAGICYLMVSVEIATGRAKNFWWQIEHDFNETREIMRLQSLWYNELSNRAQNACKPSGPVFSTDLRQKALDQANYAANPKVYNMIHDI